MSAIYTRANLFAVFYSLRLNIRVLKHFQTFRYVFHYVMCFVGISW